MGFVTTPGHPNEVAGGKRPMHSIIPAFLTRGGQPTMAFGVVGGNMQAQSHTQMVLRHVSEGLNPQACSDTMAVHAAGSDDRRDGQAVGC